MHIAILCISAVAICTERVEAKLDLKSFPACSGSCNLHGACGGKGFAQAELSRANQQTALMQQLNAMQAQAADCCCKTQTAIQGVNYNLATQACDTRNTIQNGVRDILDNANANARAVIDALTAQRIEAKDEKIAAQNQQIFGLQLAASQAAQNQYLVNTIRPCPVPAYTVANPFCCNQAQYCAG